LCPNNAAYYGNRAAAYIMVYKYKEAIEDSKKSTSIDENFVKGYSREGKCHLILGDFKSALRCFQKIKQLEPDNKSVDVDVNKRMFLIS
jgi:tetratricopeptide (TPR) repeat protein